MARSVTRMTIYDAFHYDEKTRETLIASYPKHVRRARAMGLPAIGEGAVFPIEDEAITCPGFEIPPHYMELGGLDFGWDHPTAAVRIAFDRDEGTTYLTSTYRKRQTLPLHHAEKLKSWGKHLPFAWGTEGLQTKLSDNPEQTVKTFRKHGLKMMDRHATFPEGGVGVEQGVQQILTDMETGKFKVFAHLSDFLEEKNSYHRARSNDQAVAKIVKTHDDLIDALRYAYMMRRHAVPVAWRNRHKATTNARRAQRKDSRDIFGGR